MLPLHLAFRQARSHSVATSSKSFPVSSLSHFCAARFIEPIKVAMAGTGKQCLVNNLNFKPGLSAVLLHPGISAASAEATRAALMENTQKYHCFFNDKHFHNHIAHHLLALYSLGAPSSVIKAAFEREAPEQRPALTPVDEILDELNWTTHLGDDKYYPSYLSFFSSEVHRLGPMGAVNHYLFRQVEGNMLNRSLGGVYHPMIHWGYGLEFGNEAIVAEGLAIAAVHGTELMGLKFNELVNTAIGVQHEIKADGSRIRISFQDTVQDLRAGELDGRARRPSAGLTAFEILHGISSDSSLATPHERPDLVLAAITEVCERKSNALLHWTDQWVFQEDLKWSEIVSKTEELVWVVVALYAASYEPGPSPYTLDFFLMHCVTSSIFLPTLLQKLDKYAQKVLLVAFFRSAMAIWLARGRPPLHLAKELDPKSVEPESSHDWQSIISSAAIHPDEHTTKTVRTLMWASQLFGSAPKGVYGCTLPDSAELDGSMFYHAAVKTLNKQGWKHDVRVGRPPMKWFS